MTKTAPRRRTLLAATAGIVAAGTARARAATAPPLPKSPQPINIIDVGGALVLVQKPLENYRDKHRHLVGRMSFTKAPAPELPAKLKAQEAAGRAQIDLVLGGLDALSAGIDQGLWVRLLPDYASVLPDPKTVMLPGAFAMHGLGQGYGMCMVYTPSGPLIEYAPERVKTPPTSAQELLDWTRAHKNRFFYARPANSGPGRTWLMGLPYLLGDANPKDPMKGWDKSWAYLKELGQNIEYYPTGTGQTMQELGQGSRDMILSTAGWDINPRALGIVPKSVTVGRLKGFHWVSDAQYLMIPKGVPPARLAVLLDLVAWMLKPDQQAYTYDAGYFYPGPAVKDVPVSMAPAASRKALAEYGRPEYDKWFTEAPLETPLTPGPLVAAFARWDKEIGASKTK